LLKTHSKIIELLSKTKGNHSKRGFWVDQSSKGPNWKGLAGMGFIAYRDREDTIKGSLRMLNALLATLRSYSIPSFSIYL